MDSKKFTILDTDLGDWIDDTYALTLLLNSPELDLKLIVGSFGNTVGRAKIIAKYLTIAKRHDVSIGIGIANKSEKDVQGMSQASWAEDFQLNTYQGKIYQDGVQALIDTIMNAPGVVTLICIAPLTNIAAALKKEPKIAKKTDVILQIGSFPPHNFASWNVQCDIPASQVVLQTSWRSKLIVPYNICKFVTLDKNRFGNLLKSKNELIQALITNHYLFVQTQSGYPQDWCYTLFDTAAIYSAFSHEWVEIQEAKVLINEKGFTLIHDKGIPFPIVTSWKNLPAFQQMLEERLLKHN